MPKGIPLTSDALGRRRHEVFAAAAPLFAAHGFSRTAMREVAAASGMSKASLYDYFAAKDDILVWFCEDEIDDLAGMARDIARQPLPAAERLHRIVFRQLERMVGSRELYLSLLSEVPRLSPADQRRLIAKRHSYQDLLRGIVQEGIDVGAFRPVDPLVATQALLMTLLPALFTARPSGTPAEMLDEAFALFLRGVLA